MIFLEKNAGIFASSGGLEFIGHHPLPHFFLRLNLKQFLHFFLVHDYDGLERGKLY